MDCRYILNPPWLNGRGKADVTVHQHLAMGEGDVDFDGIFETLREMDFASKQLKPDAPKAGGDNIACVSMFGFPERWISRHRKQESGLRENCWGNDRVIAADQKENCNK